MNLIDFTFLPVYNFDEKDFMRKKYIKRSVKDRLGIEKSRAKGVIWFYKV